MLIVAEKDKTSAIIFHAFGYTLFQSHYVAQTDNHEALERAAAKGCKQAAFCMLAFSSVNIILLGVATSESAVNSWWALFLWEESC